ncbi:unnamed protein product [Protopolystoma xenopodis]|uniref:Ig-like domain-containing protein n=1 Tax=Protopolystoma xenopodis TaxID=117903 RepID=A0A448WM98_9PLAT|nr:unnamed protein product [Protopolystoma xenopodis]
MNPASFGEFVWDGYSPFEKNLRTELSSIWIDSVPRPHEKPSFSPARTRLVYGTNGVRWGWYIDTETELRSYICQANKSIANQLMELERGVDYGQIDLNDIQRAPCFVKQPFDVWYLPSYATDKFAEFTCMANGNPVPTYRWYKLGYIQSDLVQSNASVITRTLIDPLSDPTGRIAISMGSLVIHYADPQIDAQDYQCEAINQYGSILSRTARIVFVQLETFQKQPKMPRTVAAHRSITIPCDPIAHSPPDTLKLQTNVSVGDCS